MKSNYLFTVIILCCFIITGIPFISAQEATIWPDLDYGSYAIGFKTVEQRDYTRTFGPKYDYFGKLLPGNTIRPIQMCIWYPAQKNDLPPMVYGEYVFPYPGDDSFFDYLTQIQNRETGLLGTMFQGNSALLVSVMNVGMRARKNAPVAEGSFPVIIYHPDVQHSITENALLCEYLASHGFVTVSSHSMGAYSLQEQVNAEDVLAAVRDREFLLSLLRDQKMADLDRLGVMGFGVGGLSSLLFQMRNVEIDAVAGLNSLFLFSQHQDFTAQIPSFNPKRLSVPCMQLFLAQNNTTDVRLVEEMKYAPRFVYQLQKGSETDLVGSGFLAGLAEDVADAKQRQSESYQIMCRYVVQFFNAYLNSDKTSEKFLQNSPEANGFSPDALSVRCLKAEERPPTRAQFIDMIRTKDIDTVLEISEKFNLDDPESPLLTENEFNALGYFLIQRNKPVAAKAIFKMGVEVFPNSANAWDSFGEACMANGDYEQSLQYYKKALELLPADTTTPDQLKQLIEQNAPDIIKRLEGLIAGEEKQQNP
ncbi:tetratricopeptide repeat protein [candidate division CSSED10-310 bacterium]|uniref:Tetratricopeptide repeat protein n=1 Tax=candidate division CSSED10-310 bacterium TaxID=2855610 RepID=A0ABV6YUJ1_UNCC1